MLTDLLKIEQNLSVVFFPQSVAPENIHTSPTEEIFSKTPPPLWKFQIS